MGEGGKRKARQEEAPAPPSHRLLTSDELGLLKVTDVPSGSKWEETAAKQRWGQPDKLQGATRLQVHCPDWDPDRILVAVARASGRVTLHCPAAAAAPPPPPPADGGSGAAAAAAGSAGIGALDLGSFRAAPPATTSGRSDTSTHELRALRFAQGGEGSHQLRLLTATAGGHVAIPSWGPGDRGEGQQTNDDGDGGDGGGGGAVVRTWQQQQQQQCREVLRFQTISDVQDMDVSSSGRFIAVGGDGHQLRVWDLAAATTAAASAPSSTSTPASSACQPLFAGKAGKPSRSGLQDLAHVTAVSYVPGRDDQLVLVGTAKHKLWLYDMRAGRKPQVEVVWGEGRITAMLPQLDGSLVWVGNGRGQVEALDLRLAPGKVVMGHALKGSAGSIRSLSLHPSQPLIASVSLDRHLRVHSTTTRQLLTKVYLKQALTGVAWLPAPKAQAPPAGPEEADDGEQRESGRREQGAWEDDAEDDGNHNDRDAAEGGEQEGRGSRAARGREQPSGGGKAPRRRDGSRQQQARGDGGDKGRGKGANDRQGSSKGQQDKDKGRSKEMSGKDKSQKRRPRDGGGDA